MEVLASSIRYGGRPAIQVVNTDITERKQAEEALRESEDRFRSLSEASLEGIMIHDQGVILDANPAFARLFGYEQPDELIGKNGPELMMTPQSQVHIIERIQRQEEGPLEFTGIRKDGHTFQAETESRAIKYRGRNARIVSCRDITERRRAELALRESEEKFRLAFGASPDSININRMEDGLYVDINEGFTRITGFTRNDVIGKNSLELNLWHDPIDRRKLLQGLHEKGSYENLEAVFRRKDGSLLTGLMSAKIISLNGVEHILTITRDISERKQVEEALQEKEHLLSESQRIAQIGSWSLGNGAELIQWTDETYRIYGVKPGSFVPTVPNLVSLIYPADQTLMGEWIRGCWAGEHPEELEFHVIHPDGTVRTLHGRGDLECAADGSPVRIVGTVQDFTKTKRAEEEKAKLEAQLQQAQKMESVGRLAGGVAHDFNNMLGVILGHAEMALSQTDPTQPLYDDLTEIRKAAQRSADLTRQLLAFARKQTVAPRVLDLNETVPACSKCCNGLSARTSSSTGIQRRIVAELRSIRARLTRFWPICASTHGTPSHGVGKITIGTENSTLDETYCADHTDLSQEIMYDSP